MKKKRSYIVVDAHGHPDWHGHDLAKTLENMELYGISKMWLLSWEAPITESQHGGYATIPGLVMGTEHVIPFSRCVSYSERAPGKFILGHAPDPRRPQAIDELQAAIEIYGVRVCGELKLRMMYDNPDAIRLYRFCGEKKVPVIMHFDYDYDNATGIKYPWPNYWQGGGIEVLERVLRKCPETIFLGHAPGFWVHLSGDDKYKTERYPSGPIVPGGKVIEMLRRFPNLYCDMSAGSAVAALKRDEKFSFDFLMEFQDRVLYARDCFSNEHQEFIDGLNLPDGVQRKIYGRNAERLISNK